MRICFRAIIYATGGAMNRVWSRRQQSYFLPSKRLANRIRRNRSSKDSGFSLGMRLGFLENWRRAKFRKRKGSRAWRQCWFRFATTISMSRPMKAARSLCGGITRAIWKVETALRCRQVLEEILQLPHRGCEFAALHGLNHLHPDAEASAMVARYLETHRTELEPKDVAWIERCRDGKAL